MRNRLGYDSGCKIDPKIPACPIHCRVRNFAHASLIAATPPVEDGPMEIGAKLPTGELHDVMDDRFQRKSYPPQDALLVLT